MKRVLLFLAVLCLSGGCGVATAPDEGWLSLEIAPESLVLTVSQTGTLRVTLVDHRGERVEAQAAWQSRAPAVASVSTAGEVSAVAAGTTWILASVGTLVDSAMVTVNAPVTGPKAAIFGIAPASVTLNAGDTVRFMVTSATQDQPLRWATFDSTKVVLLDSNGLVRAIGSGSAIVRAMSNADSTRRAHALVTIR